MPADLDAAKYVAFTTYKRDGTAKSLPVWVVPFEGGYAFTTDPNAHKVKRVLRDPRATLAVSSFKGVVAEGTPVYSGAAVVLSGKDGERVAAIVKKKYRLMYTLITLNSMMKRLLGKETHSSETAIKVMLAE